ncbi:UNVERIFIED_CONTAM: hypothetical protein Sradi_3506200 [Sesamum radiatum]|uniref:S-protein homolog n=1 Tax=Sesamum radiatum TaxID=300843 RepID=A0AAW2QET6_SESRA
MGDNTMKIKALIRFLVVWIILVRKISAASSSPGYEVEIFDGLLSDSPPLTFRCASGAADIGNHTLKAYQYYKWSAIHENVEGKTSFFCNFEWGGKHQAFVVFESTRLEECSGGLCFWLAQSDGFYFRNHQRKFDKKYDWY